MSNVSHEQSAPHSDGGAVAPNSNAGLVLFGLIAFGVWVWAAWSSVVQKQRADRLIRDAWDISAVQIQQLNGQVTSHAIVAMVVAMAATVPLLIVAVSALTSDGTREVA